MSLSRGVGASLGAWVAGSLLKPSASKPGGSTFLPAASWHFLTNARKLPTLEEVLMRALKTQSWFRGRCSGLSFLQIHHECQARIPGSTSPSSALPLGSGHFSRLRCRVSTRSRAARCEKPHPQLCCTISELVEVRHYWYVFVWEEMGAYMRIALFAIHVYSSLVVVDLPACRWFLLFHGA